MSTVDQGHADGPGLCLGLVKHHTGLCADRRQTDRQNGSYFKCITLGYRFQAPPAISTSQIEPFYLGKDNSLLRKYGQLSNLARQGSLTSDSCAPSSLAV